MRQPTTPSPTSSAEPLSGAGGRPLRPPGTARTVLALRAHALLALLAARPVADRRTSASRPASTRATSAARQLEFGGVLVNDVPTTRFEHQPLRRRQGLRQHARGSGGDVARADRGALRRAVRVAPGRAPSGCCRPRLPRAAGRSRFARWSAREFALCSADWRHPNDAGAGPCAPWHFATPGETRQSPPRPLTLQTDGASLGRSRRDAKAS